MTKKKRWWREADQFSHWVLKIGKLSGHKGVKALKGTRTNPSHTAIRLALADSE
jgi:hypothetical protein